MKDQLNQAAIHLSAAQCIIEDNPTQYSEKLWDKVADILSDLVKIEDLVDQEENRD